jgi:predicted O-methyltransferase YrrM
MFKKVASMVAAKIKKSPTLKIPSYVQEAIDTKPEWIDREIKPFEAAAIAHEIKACGAATAIEIGVASGFSSLIILRCLQNNDPDYNLRAFDLSEQCYFEKTKKTGQVVFDRFKDLSRYNLTTGVTSADLAAGATDAADFVFIDAGHRHPWPALDLLSLYRFAKPGGTVGLHDINWPLESKNAYRQNGPRDLIRSWMGKKRVYKDAPNIGFITVAGPEQAFESICRALLTDWDEKIDDRILRKFLNISEYYGPSARARLSDIFNEKMDTAEKTQLLRPGK